MSIILGAIIDSLTDVRRSKECPNTLKKPQPSHAREHSCEKEKICITKTEKQPYN